MSSLDPDKKCLSASQMLLSHSVTEQFLNAYLVPVITLLGISGNLINLTVLLTPSLRNRSNTLLASLAITDILYLIFMLPHSLANHNFIALNSSFRRFYYSIKLATTALANWCSAIAIWLILTICFERLIGIRYPLSSRKGRLCNAAVLIIGIIVLTGVLTAYHHFSRECRVKVFCHGTQVHQACFSIDSDRWFGQEGPNPNSKLMRRYVRWSFYFNAIGLVLLPTVLIVFSNVLLVQTLNERKAFLRVSTSLKSGPDKSTTNQMNAQIKTEQRVTLTVCLIVSSFIVTQAPSAVYQLFEIISGTSVDPVRAVVYFLVTFGKSVNFLLFCLSSPSFRQRLIFLTKNRFNRSLNKKTTKPRKISVETEMTIGCNCNENYALLKESYACNNRAHSDSDNRQKSISNSRNSTTNFNCQQQTNF